MLVSLRLDSGRFRDASNCHSNPSTLLDCPTAIPCLQEMRAKPWICPIHLRRAKRGIQGKMGLDQASL